MLKNDRKCELTIMPENKSVFVAEGTSLVEAAGQVGVILNMPCGGRGSCGKCKVFIRDNAVVPCENAKEKLTEKEIFEGARLACRMRVEKDISVLIPPETRFFEQAILTEGRDVGGHQHEPNLLKRHLCLQPPSVKDSRSDMDRVLDGFSDMALSPRMDISVLQRLPLHLRNENFETTVVIEGDEILACELPDTGHSLWGVALDIGTTTIVGALVDLTTGELKAVAGRTNPQIQFSDDVVGRIKYVEDNEKGLEKLHKVLIEVVNDILGELCGDNQIERKNLFNLTAVGNTTMSHFLLEIDPSPIAHAPYVPAFRQGLNLKAESIGVEAHHNANFFMLPNIAGFIGSDTVAVAMASQIHRSDEILLAVDIGTNGELVIGNRDKLLACSCAAGPAFEGARIRQGMRGAQGAINKVIVDDQIHVDVIGGGQPRGICGSGLLDAVAELLDAGLIEPTGKIPQKDEIPDSVPQQLVDAVTELDGEPAILIAGGDGAGANAVFLTQKDIREMQLAKAAIAAGISVVIAEIGIKPQNLHKILLAGGFGNFLRRSSAKRVGLLPDVPTKNIEFIGNAALIGARNALTCSCCRKQARDLSRNIEYLELANRPEFQQHYMEAMVFPK